MYVAGGRALETEVRLRVSALDARWSIAMRSTTSSSSQFLMWFIFREERVTIVVLRTPSQDGNRDLSDSRKERLLPEGAQGSSLCLVYCCGVGCLEPPCRNSSGNSGKTVPRTFNGSSNSNIYHNGQTFMGSRISSPRRNGQRISFPSYGTSSGWT